MSRTLTRDEARLKIVQAANRWRVRSGLSRVIGLHTQRHLQQCVAIVRNRRLVKPEVLLAAGFNVHGPNYRPGRAA